MMDDFESGLRDTLEDFTAAQPSDKYVGLSGVHESIRAQDRRRQALIAAVIMVAALSAMLVSRIGTNNQASTVIADEPEGTPTAVVVPDATAVDDDATADDEAPADAATEDETPTPEQSSPAPTAEPAAPQEEAEPPAPTAPPSFDDDGNLTLEAEGSSDGIAGQVGAQLAGGFSVAADDTGGASQGYFVQSSADGDAIEFEFEAPASENFVLSARASNVDGEAGAAMWILGSNKRTRWEPPVGEWEERVLISAFYAEGPNTIRFEALAPGIAIDSIRIRPLAGPRPDIDNVRRGRLRALLGLYKILGNETESFDTIGGEQDSGDGAVYLTGADIDGYGSTTIGDALLASVEATTEEEQAAFDEVATPLPDDFDASEIVAMKCAGRIAVFTKSAGLAPTLANSTWWVDNECPMWPMLGDPSYFELSQPPGGFDQIRVAAADALIEGFQQLQDATGTVVVEGGLEGRGEGNFYATTAINTAYSDISLAQGLQNALDDAEVAYEVALDFPPDLGVGELIAVLCEGRIGIFTPSDGIEPSADHSEFWSANDCSTEQLDDGRTYFVLTE